MIYRKKVVMVLLGLFVGAPVYGASWDNRAVKTGVIVLEGYGMVSTIAWAGYAIAGQEHYSKLTLGQRKKGKDEAVATAVAFTGVGTYRWANGNNRGAAVAYGEAAVAAVAYGRMRYWDSKLARQTARADE